MCTKQKLEEILEESEVRLRSNQVVLLFNRNETLFERYLDHINSLDQSVGRRLQGYEDKKVLKHIALNNPKLLLDLQSRKKIHVENLGRRTSKTIVNLVIEDIPEHLDHYLKLLNNGVIVKKLGINFEILYKQIFPENMPNAVDMYSTHNTLLVHYPKHSRWNVFFKTFIDVFPTMSIEELLPKFDFSFLKLNSDRQTTLEWARLKYAEKNDYRYLKHFQPSDCFELIKNLINENPEINNYYLVEILLQNCCTYNCVFLEKVLEYTCLQSENESYWAVSDLFETLCNLIDHSNFRKEHCIYIWQLIKFAQKDRRSFLNKNEPWSKACGKSVQYAIKIGMDIKQFLINFIDFNVDLLGYCFDEIDDKSFEHSVLSDLCDTSCDMYGYSDFENFQCSLITYIAHFSIKCPEYIFRFSELPHFVEIIIATFNKPHNFTEIDLQVIGSMFCYKLVFPQESEFLKDSRILELMVNITNEMQSLSTFKAGLKLLLKKNCSIFEEKIIQVYFEKLYDQYPMNDIPQWFLRNKPRSLLLFFDKIIVKSLTDRKLLDTHQLKHYSHLKYDQKVYDFYKKQLSDKNSFSRSKGLEFWTMKILSNLLPTDDLIQYINANFLPKKDKLDLKDEEMKEVYELQCVIAKLLHNVIEPTKMLPLLMNFCRGDYLQPALRSLYSLFQRSRESGLNLYIEILSKQAVSVRKHAMFLSCLILEQTYVLNFMQTTKENNVSSNKYLFSAILKYFLKNPSEEVLYHVTKNLSTIDFEHDSETLTSLSNIDIPKKHRVAYIEKIWAFFESSKGSLRIKQYLENLLICMSIDILQDFSFSFVEHLISSYFILPINEKLEGFERFVTLILEYRDSEREYNIDRVLEMLSKSNNTTISSFIKHFNKISSTDEINKETTDVFVRCWTKYFSILDTFEENISLRILQIYLKCHSAETFAQHIVMYMRELIDEYGFLALKNFKLKLTEIIENLSDTDKYDFFYNLLKNESSPQTCVLVLGMLQHSNEKGSPELLNIHSNILNMLSTVNDPIVCVYFKLYLSQNKF